MAPALAHELTRRIKEFTTLALSILLAKQNIHFAAQLSDRACVIEKRQLRFQGATRELAANAGVKQKYRMMRARAAAAVRNQRTRRLSKGDSHKMLFLNNF